MERGQYFLKRVDDGQSSKVACGATHNCPNWSPSSGQEEARVHLGKPCTPQLPDNAQKKAVFIDMPETSHLGYSDKFQAKARAEGKELRCASKAPCA